MSDHISSSNFISDESKSALFAYEIEQASKEGSYRLLVVDNKGVVVGDSNKSEIGKTMLIPEVIEALDKKVLAKERPGNLIYASAPITKSSSVEGAVLIVSSTEDIRETVDGVSALFYFLLAITVFMIILISFFLSKIIVDPLRKLSNVISKMSDGHLNQRLDEKGSNEFSEVASAFNVMANRLEHVDRSRQEFVSNVSHELKTPLSSLKVLSESILLQENVDIEVYKEFLGDIRNEVDRMTDVINDLLNLVKTEQTEKHVVFTTFNLCELSSVVIKRLKPIAEQKNINLTLEAPQVIEIVGDSVMISLALTNLVENAIKYTPTDGKVQLTLDCDHQNAFIKVEDTGIGIAEEEYGKIFERFYRVDKTRDRETGGTGLGLSITLSTVLLHDGNIKVNSAIGEGSTFLVRLPLFHNQ